MRYNSRSSDGFEGIAAAVLMLSLLACYFLLMLAFFTVREVVSIHQDNAGTEQGRWLQYAGMGLVIVLLLCGAVALLASPLGTACAVIACWSVLLYAVGIECVDLSAKRSITQDVSVDDFISFHGATMKERITR